MMEKNDITFSLHLTLDGKEHLVTAAAAAKAKRTVTVQFDGGVNSKLPWAFNPEQLTMQVVPGELYEAKYFARNDSDKAVVGSAVPSVAPARASGYFNKTECFCFTAQTLQAGEQRDAGLLAEKVAKLEEHGMTHLGEHGDITLDVSRRIYEAAR